MYRLLFLGSAQPSFPRRALSSRGDDFHVSITDISQQCQLAVALHTSRGLSEPLDPYIQCHIQACCLRISSAPGLAIAGVSLHLPSIGRTHRNHPLHTRSTNTIRSSKRRRSQTAPTCPKWATPTKCRKRERKHPQYRDHQPAFSSSRHRIRSYSYKE